MNLLKLQGTQKSYAFLCTNNERSEREIKETITFIITSKRMKYLGGNLLKEGKVLWKLYDNDERNWRWHRQMDRYAMFLGLEELKLWKWLYYPRQSTDSKQSLQITNGIFQRATTNF